MNIKVISKDYELELDIKHKLNLINSLSGTGKTSMGKYIDNALNKDKNCRVYINDRISDDVIYINERNKGDLIRYSLFDDKVLILDELDLYRWNEADVKDYNTKYDKKITKAEQSPFIMAINNSKATLVLMQRNERMSTSVALDAIYNFKNNGRKHWIEPKYALSKINVNNVYDEVITEDAYSGYYLMESLYGDRVVHADGKDKVANKIIDEVSKNKVVSIFLFVDTCAFGTCAENIFKVIESLTPIKIVIANVESVEYLLLNSNMFEHLNIEKDRTKLPVLVEHYYAHILNDELIKHTSIGYSKGNRSKCLYDNCCHIDVKKSKDCRLYLGGNKLEQLFKGTQFEYILRLKISK